MKMKLITNKTRNRMKLSKSIRLNRRRNKLRKRKRKISKSYIFNSEINLRIKRKSIVKCTSSLVTRISSLVGEISNSMRGIDSWLN